MPASTRELLRVNLRLQGANAVMGDIPVELPVSPSSLDVEHEQLTVRPSSLPFARPLTSPHQKANRRLYT